MLAAVQGAAEAAGMEAERTVSSTADEAGLPEALATYLDHTAAASTAAATAAPGSPARRPPAATAAAPARGPRPAAAALVWLLRRRHARAALRRAAALRSWELATAAAEQSRAVAARAEGLLAVQRELVEQACGEGGAVYADSARARELARLT